MAYRSTGKDNADLVNQLEGFSFILSKSLLKIKMDNY